MFFSGNCLHQPPILLAAHVLHEKAAKKLFFMLLLDSFHHLHLFLPTLLLQFTSCLPK
jgi:hypothetical protein